MEPMDDITKAKQLAIHWADAVRQVKTAKILQEAADRKVQECEIAAHENLLLLKEQLREVSNEQPFWLLKLPENIVAYVHMDPRSPSSVGPLV